MIRGLAAALYVTSAGPLRLIGMKCQNDSSTPKVVGVGARCRMAGPYPRRHSMLHKTQPSLLCNEEQINQGKQTRPSTHTSPKQLTMGSAAINQQCVKPSAR